MSTMVRAYIAIGSNLGDRQAVTAAALELLNDSQGMHVIAVSSMHETEPVGPSGQGRYINAAAALETDRSARRVLETLLGIERALGRVRDPEQRWGPRIIDLDLMLYGEAVLDEPGLRVPHPRMHERAFMLEPLAEIAADIRHPVLGRTIQSLCRSLSSKGVGAEPSAGE
jgi:2-amino-4-hydroxy-6-hydroxymethyldihydropteridine diphosphokinase